MQDNITGVMIKCFKLILIFNNSHNFIFISEVFIYILHFEFRNYKIENHCIKRLIQYKIG